VGCLLRGNLLRRIVLGTHSLATDGPINEFQFVLCRGLLAGLGPQLRQRVLRLVQDSLCPLGLVALDAGPSEPLPLGLTPFASPEGIWRRTS
jgi:chemotaxis methyl-accepting protein methylase